MTDDIGDMGGATHYCASVLSTNLCARYLGPVTTLALLKEYADAERAVFQV